MLKPMTVTAAMLGSLILSAPLSAQSGARITLGDSPAQAVQSVVETPIAPYR